MTTRKLFIALFVCALLTTPLWASDLDGNEDFGNLADDGFENVVTPASILEPDGQPTLSPNAPPGDEQNTYPWGMDWFYDIVGGDSRLVVGTGRNTLCLLAGGFGFGNNDCPFDVESQLPVPRHPEDAAEVWFYRLGDAIGGLNGTWERVFSSPTVSDGTMTILCAGVYLAQNPDDFLGMLVACSFGDPVDTIGYEVPRDVGVRNIEICDADDTTPTDRIYGAGIGVPGRILYYNGSTFVSASESGDVFSTVPGSLLDFAEVQEWDLGYRPLECFRSMELGAGSPVKALYTAPSGQLTDSDTTLHPWVIYNNDPSSGGSPWQAASEFGFGNPDNLGVFDMAKLKVDSSDPYGTPHDMLCAGQINRTTGAELWCTDGVTLNSDDECCEWTNYASGGLLRPVILPVGGSEPGSIIDDTFRPNPAAAALWGMNPFDVDGDGIDEFLYSGLAEAAAFDATQAEIVRFWFDEDTPALWGKYEIVAGLPRPLKTPMEMVNGSHYLLADDDGICEPGKVISGGDLDGYCEPLSGKGAGISPDYDDLGAAQYAWRFKQHEGDLFIGMLGGSGNSPAGFGFFGAGGGGADLWKIEPVGTFPYSPVTLELVTDNALGKDGDGVRTMETNDPTPGADDDATGLGTSHEAALFVGMTNPEDGLLVWMGTTDDSAGAPPIADAGPDQLLRDDEACPDPPDTCTAGNGSESTTLDGTGSGDPFGGMIEDYAWYDADPTNCAAPTETELGACMGLDTCSITPLAGSPGGTAYDFWLCVLDDDGNWGVDMTTVVVDTNLPPLAYDVRTDPPATPRFGGFGGGTPRVFLADFDGDGRESFRYTGKCYDLEDLTSCTVAMSGSDTGIDFGAGFNAPFAGMVVDPNGSIDTLATLDAAELGGDSSPEFNLIAADAAGALDFAQVSSELQEFADGPDNDGPVCGSVPAFVILKDSPQVIIDPDTSDGSADFTAPRMCQDPDHLDSEITYSATFFDADNGTTDFSIPGVIGYTPDGGFTGYDLFVFDAEDPLGEDVEDPIAVAIRVIDCSIGVVHLDVDSPVAGGTVTREACISILATSSVSATDATFTAGEVIVLGNGFSSSTGAGLVLEIDPSVFTE